MATDRVYIQNSQTFADFTRPANTTTYTAGDVMTDAAALAFKFSRCAGEPGQGGIIKSVTIISSLAQATELDADLFLFDTAPVGFGADNAVDSLTDAEMRNLVGVVSVVGTTAANTKVAAVSQAFINDGLEIPFKCTINDKALYGVLIARNAYVPGNAEVFRIKIGVQQS